MTADQVTPETSPLQGIPAGRVAQLWSWLPAFRVVAETENLRAAAELLHVTPSALSRSIRVLEDNLELNLFDRKGRNLKLNHHGRLLLTRTRQAMRGIDEGLQDLFGNRFAGELRVSSIGVATSFVLPALATLRKDYPALTSRLRSLPVDQAVRELSTGQTDVAFHEAPVATSDLSIEHLASIPNAVYCGRGHPLFEQPQAPLETVCQHEFVAPPMVEGNVMIDGWPPEITRRVGVTVETLAHGISLCRSGQFLALLPIALEEPGMRRVTSPTMAPTNVYVLRRKALNDVDPVHELIAEVKTRLRVWRAPDPLDVS